MSDYTREAFERDRFATAGPVQPPATPQEPSGAQLALADIERAYSETEVPTHWQPYIVPSPPTPGGTKP